MNHDQLKDAYDQSDAVKAICDHMAARERNQAETKLHRILRLLAKEGADLRQSEVIAGFRKLEEAGCGKYVEGRRGWQSRFVWHVKSLTVADAAQGSQLLESTKPDDSEEEVSEDAELIEHSFALRPDMTVSIELPTDLTATEASRLAAFVQSLPFDDED